MYTPKQLEIATVNLLRKTAVERIMGRKCGTIRAAVLSGTGIRDGNNPQARALIGELAHLGILRPMFLGQKFDDTSYMVDVDRCREHLRIQASQPDLIAESRQHYRLQGAPSLQELDTPSLLWVLDHPEKFQLVAYDWDNSEALRQDCLKVWPYTGAAAHPDSPRITCRALDEVLDDRRRDETVRLLWDSHLPKILEQLAGDDKRQAMLARGAPYISAAEPVRETVPIRAFLGTDPTRWGETFRREVLHLEAAIHAHQEALSAILAADAAASNMGGWEVVGGQYLARLHAMAQVKR
jgi:hypothetical protein